MAKNDERISIREYGRRLNIDEKAVRKAIQQGLLGNGWDDAAKKIIPGKADKSWGYKHKTVKPQAGVSRTKAIEKLNKKPVIPKDKQKQVSDKVKTPSIRKNTIPEAALNVISDNDDSEEEIEDYDPDNLDSEEKLESIRITKNTSAAQANKYREIFGAATDKIKLLELQGTLVKKADVERDLFNYATEFKKELQNMPKRIVEDMRAAPTSVDAMNIIMKDLNNLLERFSNTASALKS